MKGDRPAAPRIRADLAAAGPLSAPVYLSRLAAVLMDNGWAARPRYNGPIPILHVIAAAVPNLGESVIAVPGPNPHEHWFRSSTGTFLAPCTHLTMAAEAVTTILSPYVEAALSRRTLLRPTHAEEAGNLHDFPPGIVTWWGEQTRQWWAIVPVGNSSRLLGASTPEDLARAITQARS